MEELPGSKRPKVYVTRRIPQRGVDVLLRDCNVSMWDSEDAVTHGELLLNVVGVDAILCMANDVIDSEVLDAAGPSLKVVTTLCTSLEDIDISACDERGIKVLSSPDVCSESRADLAVALIILTLRRTTTDKTVDTSKPIKIADWKASLNLTFGVYGLNRLGRTIIKRLEGAGIQNILACETNANIKQTEFSSCVTHVGWNEFLAKTDVLCICDMKDKKSQTRFDKDAFAKMKSTAVVIIGEYCSSADNLDFFHLYQALREGEFSAVGINSCNQGPVPYQYPLSGLKNCVFLPQTEESSFDLRHKTSVAMTGKLLTELKNKIQQTEIVG